MFPKCKGDTRLGEWWSDEVGEVDRGGDIGRIGEIGDRLLMALASNVSDPGEARSLGSESSSEVKQYEGKRVGESEKGEWTVARVWKIKEKEG